MKDTRRTLKIKLAIIEEAQRCGNIRATARKYNIQPQQIRYWKKTRNSIFEAIKRNPQAKTINEGRPIKKPNVEIALLEWMKELRNKEIAINTRHVITKALSIDHKFHNGNVQALWNWIYVFLARNNLSIRRITHEGQKLSGHLQQMQKDVVDDINTQFSIGGTLSDVADSLFVNMDETAIFFEPKLKTTINTKGNNTVAVRCSGSNAKRMTVCVACAYDGTKLPLFFIFKGKPGARIEKNLQNELGEGVFGCCQDKGWMDERAAKIWIEKIWKPYVSGKFASFLLLDEFKCHMQGSFVRAVNDLGTEVGFIPGGYTSFLQPCDVGINKPLKKRFDDLYMNWAIEKYKNLSSSDKLPTPNRKEAVKWMIESWEEITEETIKKTYRHIGYETKRERELDLDGIIEGIDGLII